MSDGLKSIRVAVFAFTAGGRRLAEKYASAHPSSVVFSPDGQRPDYLKKKVAAAFNKASFDALLFISACGIAVRLIAPLLKGKDKDPAVVVMDETSKFAISLVSGHLGGANDLTKRMAVFFKAAPVITTATDVLGLPCVEDIADRFSLVIEDVKGIKNINAAIVTGGSVVVIDKNRGRLKAVKGVYGGCKSLRFSRTFPVRTAAGVKFVLCTSRLDDVPERFIKDTLLLRPKNLVVGVGCGRGVAAAVVEKAVRGALRSANLSPLAIKRLATIDIKRADAGINGFARKAALDIVFFSADELCSVKRPPSSGSAAVLRHTGAPNVCENAALLSSGGKRLCLKKTKTGRVAVAAAEEPFTSLE